METVSRREVDDLLEALANVLESHLSDAPGLARTLGVLDAVQDGASLTAATESLARIEAAGQ